MTDPARRWWSAVCFDCFRRIPLANTVERGLVVGEHIATADMFKVEVLLCPGSWMPVEDVTVRLGGW